MTPVVPQEIIDQILDFIPDTPDGLEILKSASLTCLSFRPRACARLFRRIELRNSDSEPTKLDILLQRAPHLLRYVQVLSVIDDVGDEFHPPVQLFGTSTTLPTSLKALRNEGSHRVTLRKIELQHLDSENTPSDMQAVLFDLLACISLCQVRLYDVSLHSPANLIDRLPPSVKSLDISHTDISLSKIIRYLPQLETLTIQFLAAKSITPEVLQTPAGWVTRLRSFTCDTCLWPVYRAIIQHASSSLEELYIIPSDMHVERFNPVDLGRFPRIRKIVITPRLSGRLSELYLASFHATIVWLSQSLSNMSHDNSIDQVTIRIYVETHGIMWYISRFDTWIGHAAWQSLDETLSQPNLASSKTFRGIALEVCTDTQDLYNYLNGLVRANLPRTEKSKKLHVTKERFSHDD